MKEFNTKKHFADSEKILKKIQTKLRIYMPVAVITKKLNMRRLNRYVCSKAFDLIATEQNLLAANIDLLMTLDKAGYIKK